jgi:hypothetical protein
MNGSGSGGRGFVAQSFISVFVILRPKGISGDGSCASHDEN